VRSGRRPFRTSATLAAALVAFSVASESHYESAATHAKSTKAGKGGALQIRPSPFK